MCSVSRVDCQDESGSDGQQLGESERRIAGLCGIAWPCVLNLQSYRVLTLRRESWVFRKAARARAQLCPFKSSQEISSVVHKASGMFTASAQSGRSWHLQETTLWVQIQ